MDLFSIMPKDRTRTKWVECVCKESQLEIKKNLLAITAIQQWSSWTQGTMGLLEHFKDREDDLRITVLVKKLNYNTLKPMEDRQWQLLLQKKKCGQCTKIQREGNFEVSQLLPYKDSLTAMDANCDLWK